MHAEIFSNSRLDVERQNVQTLLRGGPLLGLNGPRFGAILDKSKFAHLALI